MSEVPEGWTRGRGLEAFTLVRGVTYNKIDARTEPSVGMIPILRANNIQSGRITLLNDLVYVPAKCVLPKQMLQPGDLLIATSSGSRDVVGKTALASPEHSGFSFGAFCSVARPKSNSVPEWAAYFTRSCEYRKYVEEVALGININNFRTRDIEALRLPLAPPTEQRCIVAKLDRLFEHSKGARDELVRVPRLVGRYKQAILAAAFYGELTAGWREQHPHRITGKQLLAQLFASREKVVKTRVIDALDPPERELPHGWTWCPIDALSTAVTDGVHRKPDYVERGVPFLTVRNLTAGPGITFEGCRFVTKSDHQEFIKRTYPERGDLLITKDGTLGIVRAIRKEAAFSIFVSLALIKPIDRSMTDYLELALSAPQVQEQMVGVGTGLQHIHLKDLRRDLIPIAPPEERDEVVRRVHSAFAGIDHLALETARAARLLDRLDTATLAKAFCGELLTAVN